MLGGQYVSFTITSNHAGQSIQPGVALNGEDAPATSVAAKTNTSGIARAVLTSGSDVGPVTVAVTANGKSVQKTFTIESPESSWDATAENTSTGQAIDSDRQGRPILRLKLSYKGLPVNGHPINWSIKSAADIDEEPIAADKIGNYVILSGAISTTGAAENPGEAAAYLTLLPKFGSMSHVATDTAQSDTSVPSALISGNESSGAVAAAASSRLAMRHMPYGDDVKSFKGEPELRFHQEEINGRRMSRSLPPPVKDTGTRYEIIEIKTTMHFSVIKDYVGEEKSETTRKERLDKMLTFDFGEAGTLTAIQNAQTLQISLSGTGAMGDLAGDEDTRSFTQFFFDFLKEDLESGAAAERVWCVGEGFTYAVRDSITGTVEAVTNYEETWQSVKVVVKNVSDPKKRAEMEKQILAQMSKVNREYQKSLQGDGKYASRFNGRIVGEVFLIVIGDKGTQVVVKAAKGTKIVRKFVQVTKPFQLKVTARATRYVQKMRHVREFPALAKKLRATGKWNVDKGFIRAKTNPGKAAKEFAVNVLRNKEAAIRFKDGSFRVISKRYDKVIGYVTKTVNGKKIRVPCHKAEVWFGKDGKLKRLRLLVEAVCFVEGTPILMADGMHKPIEQIKTGDLVMSRDEATGATSAQRVVQTFEKQAAATLVLRLKNGETVETTREHPFYVESQGFTPAGEMGIGTSIVTRAGPSAILASSQVRSRAATVYNFEVENTHTYFVGQSELWVHNLCEFRTSTSQALNSAGLRLSRLDDVFAVVRDTDLGTGTATNSSSTRFVRQRGVSTDVAGHAIGNQLGGPGGATRGNIFPQSANWNSGRFARFESRIAQEIRAIAATNPADAYARIRVKFHYDGPIATRPSSISYRVDLGDGRKLSMLFPNP